MEMNLLMPPWHVQGQLYRYLYISDRTAVVSNLFVFFLLLFSFLFSCSIPPVHFYHFCKVNCQHNVYGLSKMKCCTDLNLLNPYNLSAQTL